MGAVREINVTPLIDLAFALLIIFMITAPLLEDNIRIDLPSTSPSSNDNQQEEFQFQTISINNKGEYFWGSTPLSPEQLEAQIADTATRENPPVFHIRADGRIDYQTVIDVIDLLKKHDLRRLSLDTRVE